jgi:hypothetical protein
MSTEEKKKQQWQTDKGKDKKGKGGQVRSMGRHAPIKEER